MKQAISDIHTLLIQAILSTVCMVVGIWATYQYGVAPNYGGWVGWLEFAGVGLAWSFLGATAAGVGMIGVNLLFYRIQVYRHGYPHDNITDN